MMPQRNYLPEVESALRASFASEGLPVLGVSGMVSSAEGEGRYRAWLEAGHHGEMAWLEAHADRKYHPERILPGCRSVVLTGLAYYQKGQPEPGEGRIARYAWGRDYHKVLGNRLKRIARALAERYPGEVFRGYTDAVALDERYYAVRGGAGFTGRNTLLIHSMFGSWFVLGEVLSTRSFGETPLAANEHGACPSGCRKCLDVCPTGALYDDSKIDARRCISYLTIEHKGTIPLELRQAMGDWIFGCDLCQEVCPFQIRKQVTQEPDFLAWRAGAGVSLVELLEMTEDAFLARFAGSPVMRAGLRGMQRNACIAAGNTQDAESRSLLVRLAAGGDALLREHAQWALAQYDCEAGVKEA